MWDRNREWSYPCTVIPLWAHAARGSVHWHTDTESSPLQPTVQPGRTAATLSSPFGWRSAERCQRGGGQEHRAGRSGCQLKSLATCHTRYLQMTGNEVIVGINTRCTRWQFHTRCTLEIIHFHIWFTASSNYNGRKLPDSDTWLWKDVFVLLMSSALINYIWVNAFPHS